MSEEQAKSLVAVQGLVVVGALIGVDFYLSVASSVSHFAVAVLVAQLISLLAFSRGQICPGQRGRLVAVNGLFALYWLAWFVMNHIGDKPNSLTDIVSLCGVAVAYCVYQHRKSEQAANSLLKMATLVAGFGILGYGLSLSGQPIVNLMEFSPIAQVLLGVLLANLALVLARNRLQGFIALLRLLMIALLAINALIFLGFTVYLALERAVDFRNFFADISYGIVHLATMAILAFSLLKGKKLGYASLFVLFILIGSLPIWARMASGV